MTEYYANACIICSATQSLKRCTRCQMISYCGQLHQKEHWPNHKNLCKIISNMMKERGVSHIFEKLRGTDMLTWRRERMKLCVEAEMRLRRRFEMNDRYIFKFPRSCFVCYESRQDLLTNCPGCPSASFCKDHPTSPIHDKVCALMKKCFEDCLKLESYDTMTLQIVMSTILLSTKIPKCSNRPASMRDYLFDFAVPKKHVLNISDNLKLYLSGIFSLSLTIFSALQKLDFPSVSELTIYAGHVDVPIELAVNWETLLHLVPDLKVLKILVLDYAYPIADDYDKEVKLCPTCRSRGKRLIVNFEEIPLGIYMKLNISGSGKKPDILVYSNMTVPEKDDFPVKASSWLKDWPMLNCPLIITSFTEIDNRLIKKTINSLFGDVELSFDGENPFRSLFHFRTYEDGGIGSSNHHMIIMKPGGGKKTNILQHSEGEVPTIKEKLDKTDKIDKTDQLSKEKLPPKSFYATACQVCHSANASVNCKRCKMIFYCSKAHKTEDQSYHKDLCKVILGMMNERGAPHLFDKMKTSDSETWLRAKIDLMKKAKLKLGRDLLDYEKEIFLFPKTCFVCHESDLSVLKNCNCGTSLCKIHKDDSKHKKFCRSLSLAFKLTVNGKPQISKATVKALKPQGEKKLPSSMAVFVDLFLQLKKDSSVFKDLNIQKILISDFLTKPLTLIWILQKLNCKINSSIVVHVIGASNSDVSAQEYWKIILYSLEELKALKIIFIGPEILDLPPNQETGLEFQDSKLVGKSLKVESHAFMYEEYFKSKFFLKPDIILGCNLHIHESEFGISDFNWEETILTLKKVQAPFILTAESEKRAQKDHKRFCDFLKKSVDYDCLQNPFAGLIPLRDFETEKLMYSNQYVIIYNN